MPSTHHVSKPPRRRKGKRTKKVCRRQVLRDQIRIPLTAQYRWLRGKVDGVIPWKYLWKATKRDRLVLVGYPFPGPFFNPADLHLDKMEKVAATVQNGTCYFEKVSKETVAELSIGHQQDIAEGNAVPPLPRKIRSDKFTTRGCHLNPATRTKKRRRGKLPNSPEIVEDSDMEEDDEIEEWETSDEEMGCVSEIEDWEDSEMDVDMVDSDPISDW
ncbi:hypothetical protein QCA50_005257 [Cerrena zonata]|uniref:Uncharacterized protein n=1 Tax=Cerrena zonata TaxID=2478898 RepID=A0AAW0GEC9_9APHY